MKQRRILYNSDGTNVFMFKEPLAPDDIRARVDEVAGTQVDTFLICPCAGMPLYYPSKVVPMIDEYRCEARKLWADGADGICLFNFFCSREEVKPLDPPFFLLKDLGDPRTIKHTTSTPVVWPSGDKR